MRERGRDRQLLGTAAGCLRRERSFRAAGKKKGKCLRMCVWLVGKRGEQL